MIAVPNIQENIYSSPMSLRTRDATPKPFIIDMDGKNHFAITNIKRKPRELELTNLLERTPYNLFLDDYRTPNNVIGYAHSIGIRPDLYIKNQWVIVIDYNHFVETITERGLPKIVSFDHDLADCHYMGDFSDPNEKTGMDCAKWLIDYCIDNNLSLPEYYVHSMNPVGRQNIKSILDGYKQYSEGI